MAIQYIYFVDTENIPLDTIKGYNINKKGGLFIIICNKSNVYNNVLKCEEFSKQYRNFEYRIFEVPVGLKDSLDIQLAYLVGYYIKLYHRLSKITVLSKDKIYYPLNKATSYLGVFTSFPLLPKDVVKSLEGNMKGSFIKVADSRNKIKM